LLGLSCCEWPKSSTVVTTFFPTIGGSKCKNERIGITMTEEKWNQSLSDQESTYFKNLESKILMAVSKSFEIKVAVFKVTFAKACVNEKIQVILDGRY